MLETAQPNETLKAIEESGCNKVKVAVVDIDGILRGKYLHKEKFLGAVKSGFGFCSVIFGWDCGDVCYDNSKVSGWHNGYPDSNAQIDLNTFRRVPWDNNIPFFLADFVGADGSPMEVCPRGLLKNTISRAKQAGFSAKFGLEFEWFNFNESADSLQEKNFVNPTPITPGAFGYSILRPNLNLGYFSELMDELAAFSVPLEGLHTETGPGVLEAAILYSDALEAADRAVLFKTAVKEIAHRHKMIASFMAKWNNKLPGCSGHIHQSLWDNKGEKNLFYHQNGMSKTFEHYVAGQMKLLPELLPFFAPNINSYKRLVEGYWAPTSVTWGIDNRTTALRVIKGGQKSTRLETRLPGSDINPYLAVAASLAAGVFGIENKLPLEAATTGNAYKSQGAVPLARNLEEATELLAKSKIARELFGEAFVDHFVNTRIWEWRQFQQSVTSFEMERYFEII